MHLDWAQVKEKQLVQIGTRKRGRVQTRGLEAQRKSCSSLLQPSWCWLKGHTHWIQGIAQKENSNTNRIPLVKLGKRRLITGSSSSQSITGQPEEIASCEYASPTGPFTYLLQDPERLPPLPSPSEDGCEEEGASSQRLSRIPSQTAVTTTLSKLFNPSAHKSLGVGLVIVD